MSLTRVCPGMSQTKRQRKIPRLGILGLLALTSCVSSSSQRLEAILDTWVGASPDDIVTQWGAPTSTYDMQDKRLVLTYRADRMESRSLLFYHQPEVQTTTLNCQISFFSNPDRDTITAHRSSGDLYSCYDFARTLGSRPTIKPSSSPSPKKTLDQTPPDHH